jgi:hypothetical protein
LFKTTNAVYYNYGAIRQSLLFLSSNLTFERGRDNPKCNLCLCRHYIREGSYLHTRHSENLKSHENNIVESISQIGICEVCFGI